MSELVDEKEADRLAILYVKKYIDACRCKTVEEARKASVKIASVALDAVVIINDSYDVFKGEKL